MKPEVHREPELSELQKIVAEDAKFFKAFVVLVLIFVSCYVFIR